jgi:hypothetical protein
VRDAISAAAPLPELADYEESKAVTSAALGEQAFATAWAAGRALTWEQAVEEALRAEC